MSRDFAISFVLGFALFVAGESSLFIMWKIPFLVTSLCFAMGLLSTNSEDVANSAGGFVSSYLLGSFLTVYFLFESSFDGYFLLNETIKYLFYNRLDFVLWVVAFPVGYVLKSCFSSLVFYTNPNQARRQKREEFVQNQLVESNHRPLIFSLRHQPTELQTSPSIHLQS